MKAKDILEKSGFKRTSPQTTIAAVFSQLRSSHDAVFVFEEEKFLGLINIYYSFLKKRPPSQAKVARCLYHPPRLDQETSIAEIARLMVESRVYWLPIFDGKEKFLGVVSAQRLLRWLAQQPLANQPVGKLFSLKQPLFISLKDGVGKARKMMMERKTSRLLVTDREGRLAGIISSYDLRQPFSSPVETVHFLSRAPMKKEVANISVEKFIHRNLISVKEKDRLGVAVKAILREEVGSVAVFSAGGSRPIGLLSIRELLKLIWRIYGKGMPPGVEITMRQPVNSRQRQEVLAKVEQAINRQPLLARRVKNIRLVFDWLAKKDVRQPLIEIRALVTIDKNQSLRAKVRGRKIDLMINQLIAHLKKQLSRHFKRDEK